MKVAPVTNGFRSDWGRDLFAAVRSIVNTGKRLLIRVKRLLIRVKRYIKKGENMLKID